MGKRGDKRRAKSKRRHPRALDVEGFQVGPLTVERQGRHVIYQVDADHPDYAEYRRAMDAEIAQLPDRLENLRADIRDFLAPFDAFDVVGNLWLLNVPKNRETYRESADHGKLMIPELAAAILLEREGRAGTEPGSWFAPALRETQERFEQFVFLQIGRLMSDTYSRDEDDPLYGEVRAHARVHRYGVRGVCYPWQEEQTFRELCDDEALGGLPRAGMGFSADEALRLVDGVTEVGLERLQERISQARVLADELTRRADDVRSGGQLPLDELSPVVEHLAELPRNKAIKLGQRMAIGYGSYQVGETLQVTAEELAERTGVRLLAINAFLDRFSVTFGELATLGRPADIEDIRDRPLLSDAEGHFICVSPHNLLWALRPGFEAGLQMLGAKAWSRYEKHRRQVVERRATDALAKAADAEEVLTSVYYEVEEDGEKKRPEVDGIVRVDTALFLVEAKASTMRASAKRAAPQAFRDWMEKELTRASDQLERTRKALIEDHVPLETERAKRVSLDLSDVKHVVKLIVTLEDMPAVAPSTWQLADAGLLPGNPTPIAVSLHELEIICDVAERRSELVHYFLRRIRMNEQRSAVAADELDYFMHYLKFGLYWPDEEASLDGGRRPPERLLSQTDELDAYYMYARGERKTPARRPGQGHRRAVAGLLDCLDGLQEPGALDATLAFIDLNSQFRERIAGDLRRLKEQSAKDGQDHDRTYFGPGFGVTVMSVPPSRANELSRILQSYCILKKHQVRADSWLGLGVFKGPPEPAQVVGVFTQPWEPDEELDRLVAELPSTGHETERFDGRKMAQLKRITPGTQVL